MITGNSENFIKSKLLEYRSELENILIGGSISQYNYCKYTNNYNEICDVNWENRLRMALLYGMHQIILMLNLLQLHY